MATATKAQKAEREEALAKLRDMLPVGATVYTSTAHVSRSGMRRLMRVFMASTDGWTDGPGIADITYLVAKAIGSTPKVRDGFGYYVVAVDGCGMDMGFSLVYDLAYHLYPNGFKQEGPGRNGDLSGYDKNGGYALRQRWL